MSFEVGNRVKVTKNDVEYAGIIVTYKDSKYTVSITTTGDTAVVDESDLSLVSNSNNSGIKIIKFTYDENSDPSEKKASCNITYSELKNIIDNQIPVLAMVDDNACTKIYRPYYGGNHNLVGYEFGTLEVTVDNGQTVIKSVTVTVPENFETESYSYFENMYILTAH